MALTTANGCEFTVGQTAWHQPAHEYRTAVEVRDGDKLLSLTVCTPGTIRPDQIRTCVERSMQQWNYWGEKPVKGAPLKGGV